MYKPSRPHEELEDKISDLMQEANMLRRQYHLLVGDASIFNVIARVRNEFDGVIGELAEKIDKLEYQIKIASRQLEKAQQADKEKAEAKEDKIITYHQIARVYGSILHTKRYFETKKEAVEYADDKNMQSIGKPIELTGVWKYLGEIDINEMDIEKEEDNV